MLKIKQPDQEIYGGKYQHINNKGYGIVLYPVTYVSGKFALMGLRKYGNNFLYK